MEYGKLTDGQLNCNLPTTATLPDGSTVSGVQLMTQVELSRLGWYPVVDSKPAFNADTEYLVYSRCSQEARQILRIYEVVPKLPDPEPVVVEEPINEDLANAYEAIAMLFEMVAALEVAK